MVREELIEQDFGFLTEHELPAQINGALYNNSNESINLIE